MGKFTNQSQEFFYTIPSTATSGVGLPELHRPPAPYRAGSGEMGRTPNPFKKGLFLIAISQLFPFAVNYPFSVVWFAFVHRNSFLS